MSSEKSEPVAPAASNGGSGGKDSLGRFARGNPWAIKPGEARNPRGLSEKLRNKRVFTDAIERIFKEQPELVDAIVQASISMAASPDKDGLGDRKLLMDRVDGKPDQDLTVREKPLDVLVLPEELAERLEAEAKREEEEEG